MNNSNYGNAMKKHQNHYLSHCEPGQPVYVIVVSAVHIVFHVPENHQKLLFLYNVARY